MNSGPESETFSFEVVNQGRSKEVVYRLGERQLRIHLEMIISTQFDYGAATQNFETWTLPKGQSLSETEAALAQERLRQWGLSRGMRISIERGMTREESLAEMERDGWKQEVSADGSRTLFPPAPRSLLQRVVRWVLG